MKIGCCTILLPFTFELVFSSSEKELVYRTKDTTVRAEEHRKDLKLRAKYTLPDDHREPSGHRKPSDRRKPGDHREPGDHRKPGDHREPSDHREPGDGREPSDRREPNYLKLTDPDLKPTNPDLKTTNPNLKTTDPDLKTTDPDLKPTDPDLKTINPDLKAINPDLKTTGPNLLITDPDSKTTDPDLKTTDPDLGNPQPSTKVKKVIAETKITKGGKEGPNPPSQVTITTKKQISTSSGLLPLPETEEGSTDSLDEDFEREFMEEPLDDWNYVKIRSLLSQLNEAMYRYASNLTRGIIRGKGYLRRLGECSIKYKKLEVEFKAVSQDKIKLQDELDDLSSKYSTMKNILAKVRDINEDNRQLIDKLRAHRDHCIQASDSKMKTIYSLRSQAAELRRKLSHYRGNKK